MIQVNFATADRTFLQTDMLPDECRVRLQEYCMSGEGWKINSSLYRVLGLRVTPAAAEKSVMWVTVKYLAAAGEILIT